MLGHAKLNQKKQEFSEADAALQLIIASLSDQDIQPLRIFCAAPTPFVKMLTEINCIVACKPSGTKILSDENLIIILVCENKAQPLDNSYEKILQRINQIPL